MRSDPDPRKRLERSLLLGALKGTLLLYLPLGVLCLGMGGWLNARGVLPRSFTLGVSALLLMVLLLWELWRLKGRRTLPLTPESAQAYDYLLGLPQGEPGFRVLLNRLAQPFPSRFTAILLLSLAFSLGLNLGAELLIPLKPLLGMPVVIPLEGKRTLVILEEVAIRDPLTQKETRYRGHDGYLRVAEGAGITMEVRSLLPVEKLWVQFSSGATLPLSPLPGASLSPHSPSYALSFTAVRSEEYGFAGEREGVIFVERIHRILSVDPDLPPEIEWVTTPPALLKHEPGISFSFRARDDRGVTALALEVQGITTATIPLATYPAVTETGVVSTWVPLSAFPGGESLTLTLLALDNDRYPSPNTGRSQPFSLRRLSPLEEHEDFLKRLKELRKRGVLLLGDLWEKPHDPPEPLQREAQRLSYLAYELAGVAKSLPFTSPGAPQKLLGIRTLWEKLHNASPLLPPVHRVTAETAVWETDQLIGREVLARFEERSRRIEELMRLLTQAMAKKDSQEAERLLEELKRESEKLRKELEEEMRNAPPELAQEDGLRRELGKERDLFAELLEALHKGDLSQMEQLLKELSRELEGRKRMLDELRTPLISSFPGEKEITEAWSKILGLKGGQEELLKELREEQSQGRAERQRLKDMAGRQGELAQRLRRLRERLEGKGEWGEVVEALKRAETRMEQSQAHLEQEEGERAIPQMEQGLNELKEAEEAVRNLAEEKQRAARSLRSEREGENLVGELRAPLEPGTNPRTSIREEALRGFRKGIPEFGAEVNRRYLERLLH